jgi:hypothetical protein
MVCPRDRTSRRIVDKLVDLHRSSLRWLEVANRLRIRPWDRESEVEFLLMDAEALNITFGSLWS